MKKIFIGLAVLLSLGGVSSCKDKDLIPAPEVENLPIIFPQVTPGKDFFDFDPSREPAANNPTRPVFEFTIDPGNQRDVKLATIEVYRSYRRGSLIGPRIKVGDYTSFPAVISLNSQQALDGLQRLSAGAAGNLLNPTTYTDPNRLNNLIVFNDAVIFTFEYVLQDGRRIILTPLAPVTLTDKSIIYVPSGTLATATSTSKYPYAAVAEFRRK